jgi:hypothetical protein
MPFEDPVDPDQRRLAERRILDALRRFHRAEPLSRDIRTDALLRRVRDQDAADRRPRGHRGARRLRLDDAAMREVIGGLVAEGRIERRGHRLALPGAEPPVDPEMRSRIDALLGGLRAAGPSPPPVSAAATRLGIPPTTIDQLRAAGILVSLGPGIDYPRDVLEELMDRVDRLGRAGTTTEGRVAAALGTSRRYAAALLERRRAATSARASHRRRSRKP